MTDFERTIIVEKDIINWYGVNDEKNTSIIKLLCLASNTLPVVEESFKRAQQDNLSLYKFYELVVKSFCNQNFFPLCVEKIISEYPRIFGTAIITALPKTRCFLGIQNILKECPYLDTDFIKVPIDNDWNEAVNLGFFFNTEHSYVLEQLLRKFSSVEYQIKDTVNLIVGDETRKLHRGYYKFYYARDNDWLIVEVTKK